MTRLVLSYDGTWNNPGQEDNGIPAPTNVFKLHNAIDDAGDAGQQKYYHPGLGGEGGLLKPVLGGGYADCALSDIALRWMMEQAGAAGLALRPGTEPGTDGKHDGVMHNSFKGVFAKFRSRPRNIPAVCAENEGVLHPSVLERQRSSPIQYPPYHPTQVLGKGESATVDVFAGTRWNATGLYLPAGRYRFAAAGTWMDSKDSCDWRGTEDGRLTPGDIVRAASSFLGGFEALFKNLSGNESTDFLGTRRVESIGWFVLTGAICNDGLDDDGHEHAVVKGDGSPHPHQYVALPDYENRSLEIDKPGYLYCFPNDVWSLYGNNAGSVQLTVRRVK